MKNLQNAVQMRGVTKTFGPVVANNKIDLDIRQGEILALLGENGSGKTTLMNMLSGIYFPDGGEIQVRGQSVTIRSPKDAFDLGIGMIHQHFKLVDVLTAAENIVLGLEGKGRLNLREVADQVREINKKYGFTIDPEKKIYKMLEFAGDGWKELKAGKRNLDKVPDVADPWYTGNFDDTWRDVAAGCEGLLKFLD